MTDSSTLFRRFRDYRWDDVSCLDYKAEGDAPFKDVSRQILFSRPDLAGELRYFEVAPGGYSTLERHEHAHGILVLRGRGHGLVGREIRSVGEHDLITVPPMTWHQFRATADLPLGFLCLVDSRRDRPQLPDRNDLAALRSDPRIAGFLDGCGDLPTQ